MLEKVVISKRAFSSSLIYVSLLTFSFSCHPVFAEPFVEKAGWGGGLSLVSVGFTEQSQFAVEDDNRRTADLNHSGKKSNRFSALPVIRLDYTLSDLQTQFFFGNSQDHLPKKQFAMELGLTHAVSQDGKVSFALFSKLPLLAETWTDPFLTGQERQTTDENASGGRIKFEHTGANAFAVQYAFATNKVDLEESGNAVAQLSSQQRAMLNRNAEFHRFNVDINCPISQEFMIIPSLQVTTSDAQGDAHDFAEGVFKLQSLYMTEQHAFSATLGIGRKESKLENPVFKRPQNDRSLSLDVLYQYAEPLGYKNWSLLGVASWEKVDSDITFYDTQSAVLGVGLGYTW